MSNFNVQQVKPAVLKSKEVATLVDVEQVSSRVDAVDATVEGIINGGVDLVNAKVGNDPLVAFIQNEVDKKVNIYSGENITTFTGTANTNDLYIENTATTSSNNVLIDVVNTYKYDGTNWVSISNNSNLTALADLADSKRTVFTTPDVPTPPYSKGDLWALGNVIKVTTISRISGVGPASDWTIISNYISKTSELLDDADLGGTAVWGSVSGVGKPQDYADVTAISLNSGVQLSSGGIEVGSGGAIKSTSVNLASNNGVFLGHDNGKYQFLAGNSTDYIHYNGHGLSIRTKDMDIRNNTSTFILNSNATGVHPHIKGAVLESTVLKEVPQVGSQNVEGTGLDTEKFIRLSAVEEVHPGGADKSTVELSTFVPSELVAVALVTVEGIVQVKDNCTYTVHIEVVNAGGSVTYTHTGMEVTHSSLTATAYPLTTSFTLVPYHTTAVGVESTCNVPSVKPSNATDKVRVRLVRTSGNGITLDSVRINITKTLL